MSCAQPALRVEWLAEHAPLVEQVRTCVEGTCAEAPATRSSDHEGLALAQAPPPADDGEVAVRLVLLGGGQELGTYTGTAEARSGCCGRFGTVHIDADGAVAPGPALVPSR